MLTIFFDINEIVHKKFVLEGQTINSTYHCDILRRVHENVRRLLSELWLQKCWLLHYNNAPSHTLVFDQTQYDCRLHPP
jgi:hypothetical protein